MYKIRFDNWSHGYRCFECRKNSYEYVKDQIEKEGYTLLSKEYKNNKTKLKVRCPKGHIYYVAWSTWKNGGRCLICSIENRKVSINEIKRTVKKRGYQLIDYNYENGYKLKVKCKNGHVWNPTFNNLKRGSGCPICLREGKRSYLENELSIFVKNICNESIIQNDRTQIINPKTGNNLELDIWIPKLKKAIEYNPVYWHNNKYSKYKDNQKIKQCKEKGINLLVLTDNEWNKSHRNYKKIKKFLIL
jgi:hypothetical protein